MQLSGNTALYLVIGDPIAQAKSPALYTGWCVEHDVDAIFVPFQIAVSAGRDVFQALHHVPNLAGLIVTIPFKPLVAELCDTLTPRARAAGACNVIRPSSDGGWHGDALDGVGCVTALVARGISARGASVQVIGAGGAGASVAAALADEGAAHIAVDDVDGARAAALARRLGHEFPAVHAVAGREDADKIDIFVNASPAGMRPRDPLPMDPAGLAHGKTLIEMIMQPAKTALFEQAQAQGCVVVPGLEVLGGQMNETLKFFGLN